MITIAEAIKPKSSGCSRRAKIVNVINCIPCCPTLDAVDHFMPDVALFFKFIEQPIKSQILADIEHLVQVSLTLLINNWNVN